MQQFSFSAVVFLSLLCRCCVWKQTPIFSLSANLPYWKGVQKFPHNALGFEAKMGCSRLAHSNLRTAATDFMKQTWWRMHVMSVDTEESLPTEPEDYPADGEEDSSTHSSEEKLLTSEDVSSRSSICSFFMFCAIPPDFIFAIKIALIFLLQNRNLT